jgi:hypothetical protein
MFSFCVSNIDSSHSSPSNGYENAEHPISINPQDTAYGDVHYYNYDMDCWDLLSYPRPRFASEYGFQSFPSFQTLAPVSDGDLGDWNFNSSFMQHRQHHPGLICDCFSPLSLHVSNLVFIYFVFLLIIIITIIIITTIIYCYFIFILIFCRWQFANFSSSIISLCDSGKQYR